MPGRAFVIYFPNGDFEYDIRPTAAPVVGETMRRRGALWRVKSRSVRGDVASLQVEPVDDAAKEASQDSGADA